MNRILTLAIVGALLAGCQPKEPSNQQQASTQITPERTEASRKLTAQAVELFSQKKYQESVAGLDAAIKFDPGNQDPYMILGQILLEAGEYQRAADFLDNAAKNFPDNGMIFYMLSISNKMLKKKLPAVLAARRSFEIYKSQNNEQLAAQSALLLQQIINAPENESAVSAAPDAQPVASQKPAAQPAKK